MSEQTALRDAPSVSIVFEFEAAPRIVPNIATDAQRDRLIDWLTAADYMRLLNEAALLAGLEQAA